MSYQLDTPAVLTPRIRYPVKYLVWLWTGLGAGSEVL
jgi:hypothetical protein